MVSYVPNAETIGTAQKALRIGMLVMAAGPDHEHAILSINGLALVQDGKASGNIVAVKDAGGKDYDSLDQVIAQEAGAYEVFIVGLLVPSINLLGKLGLASNTGGTCGGYRSQVLAGYYNGLLIG